MNPPTTWPRSTPGLIERLPASGVPFGISLDATYEMATVKLARRDALILFTDGVVEAFNSKGEEFTDSRWVDAVRHLPGKATLRRVGADLPPPDDFSISSRRCAA